MAGDHVVRLALNANDRMDRDRGPKVDGADHCCGEMVSRLGNPASAVSYDARFREYLLRDPDGEEGMVRVAYCPWCGARLPASLRAIWFEALAAMGIDLREPADLGRIPDRMWTDAWWKAAGL